MGKHEIRLRRQRMTARGADRFRNFNNVMQRHEEEMRIKKIVKVFTLFAVILILVMLIIIVTRFEKRQEEKKPVTHSTAHLSSLNSTP
ncbi:MAG TPA: hypothetical protein VIT44_13070 [Cyclobacteriaceae bacterium]